MIHTSIIALTVLASTAAAPEHGDVLLVLPPGSTRFTTGAYDIDTGTVIDADARVFRGELDRSEMTDEPGFTAPSGSLPTNLLIGFDIVDAARLWDGSDFDAISPSTITCERFTSFVTSPPGAGQTAPGFWLDSTGASGGIHVHMSFFLDPPLTPGIYLLTLGLRTNSGTIANPEPVYIVLDNANPAGAAEVDSAVAYMEDLLTPPPACAGDVTGDGTTNIADFNTLAGNFGSSVAPGTGGDLTGDGVVNIADFNILAGDFGCVP